MNLKNKSATEFTENTEINRRILCDLCALCGKKGFKQ